MYLFLFAALFIIYQYMNEKTIFESQEKKIESLTKRAERSEAAADSLQMVADDLNYFTLQGNDNAMTYLENSGYEAKAVEALAHNAIYDQNVREEGNPLVPFVGLNGKPMRVNKVRFLNHKWLLADFTDGQYWGEMILEYSFNETNELQFRTLGSLLYPQ
ncbi:hypothetical protein ULVI_11710 [Cochleicola gelatinilyticus]|uniref:Hydrolase n=2 Tax=Cochleicola gelatinilyticus TaxID=1763537 RepID=A0A167H2C4_9FLAO|nr:hypothetical protein ULVI_11710 [Cochleicola gelatinilyticus]